MKNKYKKDENKSVRRYPHPRLNRQTLPTALPVAEVTELPEGQLNTSPRADAVLVEEWTVHRVGARGRLFFSGTIFVPVPEPESSDVTLSASRLEPQ